MSAVGQNQRRTVHYSGRVQGVGFRYTAQSIAGRFQVSGFVQNLDDGRVRLVVEGTTDELDGYLTAVSEAMGHFIHDSTVTVSVATGEFSGFSVRRTSN